MRPGKLAFTWLVWLCGLWRWRSSRGLCDMVCKACGNRVIVARLDSNGLRLPIDPNPVPDGPIVLVQDRDTGAATAYYSSAKDGRPRYTNHFATCPEGQKFELTPQRMGDQ